jgi:multidrug efflux pump subunit AcrB
MDFNYKITRFFLNNNRLTLLSFILLVIFSLLSAFFLKTTGFPNPDVKFAMVQTLYIGASSETVASDVTAPIESAIQDIEGITTMSSVSSNSFSMVSVTIDDDYDSNTVVNKIDSAVNGLTLPDGAEDSEVMVPSIAGPDFLFSLVSNNEKKLYETYKLIEADLNEIPETSEVSTIEKLNKRLLISVDEKKLTAAAVTVTDIQAGLANLGETIPVVSDVTLNNESASIVTIIEDSSIEDIKNLEFGAYKLKDLASIKIDYEFDGEQGLAAYNIDGDPFVFKALTINLKAAKNTDLMEYTETIEAIFKDYEDVKFVKGNEFEGGFEDLMLVEAYSINNDNQRQVKEVVTGLIGGEFNIDGPLKYSGYLFGGIQLVFLVMLAFVSLRAAIIAALAIPMSLAFSTIYVFAIGENLNTLVLFSLVLAIGLVVDPALVLLESIQRKIDTGLHKKEAALAAVKDVGRGLFLACLTSVIVFIPFGVVSGILGQIITYIPMTIIPAIVGSYVVPLIFLAWIGGMFLKPNKGKHGNEEENLWAISKLLIKVNEWLLNGSRILRFLIIVVALVVPLLVAGYYTSSGKVKQVQFASSENAEFLQLGYVFKPSVPMDEREDAREKVFKIIATNEGVESVFPLGGGIYFVMLKDAEVRGDYLSVDISDDINKQLADLDEDFFDIKVGVVSNGPPGSDYQIAIALKTGDSDKFEDASLDVAETLNNVCFIDNKYEIAEDCAGERVITKVDDGFTDKQTEVIEVILDREKLAEKQLLIPGAPLSMMVNLTLRNLFGINDGSAVAQINIDGEEIDIVLDKKTADPDTLTEIKNTVIYTMGGEAIKLSDIAKIKISESKSSIQRVGGETVSVVKGRLKAGSDDQGTAAIVTQAVLDYYEENPIKDMKIETYSEGDSASFMKSFQELFTALILAIVITYVVLVLFFGSFTQPLVILYAIPLTFLGVFPGLAYFGGGQFGFLEIIGLIILVGIVENVAIFLIDAAKQKIREDGWDDIRAISYASGLRLRAVILTKLTAIASLAPLAVLSEQYRSLSIVIMAGLLTSGITSLFTTPILFVFFRWLSERYRNTEWYNKVLFFPFFPIYILVWAARD